MKITNYKLKNGDIDYAYGTDIQQYLIKYDRDIVNDLKPLNIAFLNHNTGLALTKHKLIGNEFSDFYKKAEYTCYILRIDVHVFVPKFIFAENIEKYIEEYTWYKDMALDVEYTKCGFGDDDSMFWKRKSNIELNNFSDLLLGSGYTSSIGPNDGDNYIAPYLIQLDNNDYIYGYCWEWYNK